MENATGNKMAGNIGNQLPSRIPDNLKKNIPKVNAQSSEAHVQTRQATNRSQESTTQTVRSIAPQQQQITNQTTPPVLQTQASNNTETQMTNRQPQITPSQIGENPIQQEAIPVAQLSEFPTDANQSSQQEEVVKQNKITETYKSFMSPKPLEGNSLRLLIVLAIVSVIIYIATLVL